MSEEVHVHKSPRNNIVNYNSISWGFPSLVAYIGAAVYFLGTTGGAFWDVVGALIKALVWPAYVVYHVLALLGA